MYRFEDFYGSGRLVREDKSFIQIPKDGILVKVNNKTGKLYSLQDKSSHNGGHGMGQMYCCQGVISFPDMSLGLVKDVRNGPFYIELVDKI